jgi:triacylglycerol lipase
MKIVLVHGIFDNGGLFKSMVRSLEQRGHECFAPSLHPSDARLGIADLAQKLAREIQHQFGDTEIIAIIGFSMGCLIARHYLQELEGYKRTRLFFAISGPHAGSLLAHCYVGQGAVDMRPHSKFLQRLAATEHRLTAVALYAYRTPFDLMILPSTSSEWPAAENLKIPALAHPLMLSHKAVLSHITKKLDQATSEAGIA